MTDPNDFKLFAIVNVLKTLTGMLFAQQALQTSDPQATVETMRGQALRIMDKAWSTTADPTTMEAMRKETLEITAHLFREIEERVRDAPGR